MEYQSLSQIPYYTDCEKLVSGLGYSLVNVKVVPQKGRMQVEVTIAFNESSVSKAIGIDDCSKVHHLLQPRMEALLKNQDVYMEVTSPGMERHIKNAAEFSLFKNRNVKVYSTEISDWIEGLIIAADENQLTLKNSAGENQTISYSVIAKAKLVNL